MVLFASIGIIGAFLLCVRGIPQIIKTFHSKKVDDISLWMLLSWFFGCTLSLAYMVLSDKFDIIIASNYIINSISSLILLMFYWKYKKQ